MSRLALVTGNQLEPLPIDLQHSGGINPASDQFLLISMDRGESVAPGKPVPWSQGTLIINEPNTPRHVGVRDGLSPSLPWPLRELDAQAGSGTMASRNHEAWSQCFHGDDDDARTMVPISAATKKPSARWNLENHGPWSRLEP